MDLGVQPDHRCTKSWLSTSMKTLVVCYRRIDSPWDKHILLDVNNTMRPRILARFGGHAHPTFSTDGSFLIVQDNSGFKDLNLHVIDTSDGTVKLKIPSSENPLFRTFTTFSSDGNTMVWADDALRREINRTRIRHVQF
jgi:Tol biopolymer transport system component